MNLMMTANDFKNPFEEPTRALKIAEPCIIVIFGATGDLTSRKLLPALYNLAREGLLPSHFVCVGFARREKSHTEFRTEMFQAVKKFSRIKPIENSIWSAFSDQLYYHCSEFHDDQGYKDLKTFLSELDALHGTKGNRLFYLSTQPSFFPTVIEKLKTNDLLYPPHASEKKWSRVIIEKPFGEDTKSAIQLQQQITRHLDESQIFRIDHYLGKETVQNLLIFRFCNSIFESLWNSNHIDHIQITVSEDLGVGTRGRFWEESGMLRDIVQNHMMQLMSLIAMEPPTSFNASAIHGEKVKVLESIRPVDLTHLEKYAVRGQYGRGYIEGLEVPGYREEDNVEPNSNVETYAALQLCIDNWRWAGVPFYLRAGKRLPKRGTEIAVVFNETPSFFMKLDEKGIAPNVLVIRIQPDEGISLKTNCKVPGMVPHIQPVKMDFRYGAHFGLTPPEAYERLLCDCMAGDSTLFARFDEVIASWRILTPIIHRWQEHKEKQFPNYAAGTWGPLETEKLISDDGRAWRLI